MDTIRQIKIVNQPSKKKTDEQTTSSLPTISKEQLIEGLKKSADTLNEVQQSEKIDTG